MKMAGMTIQFWLYLITFMTTFTYPGHAGAGENILWDDIVFTPAEEAWLSKKHKIRVRVGFWPPFQFWENGPKGISVDYLNMVAAHCNLDFEFYKADYIWADALENLKSHRHTDLVPTIKHTSERENFVAFTSDYLFSPWVIFTRTKGDFVENINDLHGKTVAVQRGYVMHKKLENEYPEINQLIVDRTIDALQALSTDQCDAFIGNLAVGTYMIQNYGIANVKVAAPAPFGSHNQAMGIRDDWPELAGIISKALEAMPQEEHARIRQKWLAVRYEYGISWADILYWGLGITGVASLILTVILLWNRRLKTAYKLLADEITGAQQSRRN